MDAFWLGGFVGSFGLLISIVLISFFTASKNSDDDDEADDPEVLAAELRAVRMAAGGLTRGEKEILSKAADYIDKGIENDKRD